MTHIDKVNNYEDEIVKSLQSFLKIRSVEGEPLPNKPFGEGPYEALKFMLDLGKKLGFETENYDNYAGHIEMGQGKEIFGVLVHADVVPEGGDWEFDPYGGEVEDGKIYGRGTIDNKGPAIAALYAMKALKDQGIELNRRIRLIVGTNEESGWGGIDYYMTKAEKPSLGFAPDAEFPVIHAEMGILIFDLIKKIKDNNTNGLVLKSIKGGNAANMVADFAKAIVSAKDYDKIKEKIKEYNEGTEHKIQYRVRGKSFEISAQGVSAHGARPSVGLNAISVLMDLLGKLDFCNDDSKEFIDFYNEKIGFNLEGTNIGLGLSDEVSGNLVFNVGMIKVDAKTMKLTINVRYPVTSSGETVYEELRKVTDEHQFGIVKLEEKLPLYIPTDHDLVKTLMSVYQKHTGDNESKPIVIGGGTYARAIDNAVAFGAKFIEDEALEHQKNEYIKIESLMKAARIYADALLELNIAK